MTGDVYSHSGDASELLAHCYTIKALGGGHLVLFPSSYTRVRMNTERAESIASLLRLQPYIDSVRFANAPSGLNLDGWRNHSKPGYNLADLCSSWLGIPHGHREQPWLFVPQCNPVAKVVLHRSLRCHNQEFPW